MRRSKTTRTKKRKAQRRNAATRIRNKSVQFYLSDDEHASLIALTERKGCTVAELVRHWIRKSTGAYNGIDGTQEQDDPRQTTLEGIAL